MLCTLTTTLNTSNLKDVYFNLTFGTYDLPEVEVVAYHDQAKLLARLIFCESGHEPLLGKLAVGQVVLNRMAYKDKSMSYIIHQKGQFDGVNTHLFYKAPNSESILAAKLILAGVKVLPDEITYFANECVSTDTPWIKHISQYTYVTIQNHTFYWNPRLIDNIYLHDRNNRNYAAWWETFSETS
jgi:N-acetylmuramoyl-L-alanine amidase